MFQSSKNRAIFAFLLIFVLIVIFRGLFIDVTRDSGKYATIAKEIFLNGNWINLTVHGEAYLQKPPLMFWLSAISYHLFGISNFSFKFPILLFSLAGLYFTYRLGKSLYNRQIGILSAMLLLFSEYFLLYTMDIHTDSLLMPFVTFSLWMLSEYIRRDKFKFLIGASVGIGLAMLTKGPIGAAIPVFAVGTHWLLKKDFKRIFDWRWVILIVISFVVLSPALLGLYRQFGAEGIRFFFWTNNVGRVTGQYLGTNHDYFFFFHTLLYMLLPWSLFFYVAVFNEFRRFFRKKFRMNEYFLLGGTWIFFIIMSFSRSKLPNYIYILSPMMAILTAKWMFFAFKLKTKKIATLLKYSQIITEILIWTLIAAVSFYVFPPNAITVCIPIVFLFLMYIYSIWKKPGISRLAGTFIAMLALTFLLNFHVFPEIYSQQAVPKAARLFNRISEKDDTLYNYKYGQYELFFYGRDEVVQIYNQKELESAMNSGKAWIFTNSEGLSEINQSPLQFPYDSIIPFSHASLNKGFRYINPKTREKSKEMMYLLRCK